MNRGIPLAAVIALIVVAPSPALSSDCPLTSVPDLEDEVMCPVCDTTLGVAREAPQARRERAFIERRVQRCQTKAQIKSALVDEFGDRVLAEPPGGGFGVFAYLVPALAVGIGGAALALAAVRWRRPGRCDPAGAGDPTPLEPGAKARVDAELARLERR